MKSHSPKDESITWDVNAAVDSLTDFPKDATIN